MRQVYVFMKLGPAWEPTQRGHYWFGRRKYLMVSYFVPEQKGSLYFSLVDVN
jgi:hypothetical protein